MLNAKDALNKHSNELNKFEERSFSSDYGAKRKSLKRKSWLLISLYIIASFALRFSINYHD